MSFNPRPGANTGATEYGSRVGPEGRVSIRAPVRTPGRLQAAVAGSAGSWFQSAPRCEHRGDVQSQPKMNSTTLFQSAPRCEHRGDTRPQSLQ